MALVEQDEEGEAADQSLRDNVAGGDHLLRRKVKETPKNKKILKKISEKSKKLPKTNKLPSDKLIFIDKSESKKKKKFKKSS
jgi:hypothetical protein